MSEYSAKMGEVFSQWLLRQFGEPVVIGDTHTLGILSSHSALEGITPPYTIAENQAMLSVAKDALPQAPVSGATRVTARNEEWLVTEVNDGEGAVWRLTLERTSIAAYGRGYRNE